MKLRIETRHRLLVIATGGDAEDLEDQGDEDEVDAVAGTGGSADLTATDRRLSPTEPDARRRRGAIGFTEKRSPTA